ncbi:MAG: hypothetical protein H7144_09805, partial [Burkholderiales bacterium]|nr:hypothetical protein [Phycisphaerae bacterium]
HTAAPATKPAAHAAVDLERSMKAMERSLKQLERQAKDESQSESSLRIVAELQQHVLTAKLGVPHTPDNFTPEQTIGAVLSYRKRMGILLQQLVDLETAILDKNQKKIADTLTAIHNTEKAGHEQFNVKEH